ncbi:hypothetical protein PR003_g12636 [Phytophthora rubi]|uniref:Endonuclease/exonuclease/phosphatase domain-containing protein n=1 Tax=Phytophthora rubi TaxID=129364 RepID=A0A6A4EZR6_9STRA|nr:hypothetical protein PR003_g12636 [Phytophthora rubi]
MLSSVGQRSRLINIKGAQGQLPATPEGMAIGAVGDAYGRSVSMRDEERRRKRKKRQAKGRPQWILETQNVRGFVEENRQRWMGAWRRTPMRERPKVWLLQETHVSTEDEALELEATWARLWGKQHQVGGPKLSYWSIDESKTGGVAILLNPSVANEASPWMMKRWSKRVIAINLGGRRIVNIYAPNPHADRECFFEELKDWSWGPTATILAGDFNCVLCPALDRMGGIRSGRSESQTLSDLMLQLEIEDANILAGHAEEEDEPFEPTEYYTYWGPEAASRIDRIYVPGHWTDKVQWVVVEEPPAPSDHQRIRLYLGGGGQSDKKRSNQQRGMVYPIRSAHPEVTKDELLEELRAVGIGQNATSQTWDRLARQCGDYVCVP